LWICRLRAPGLVTSEMETFLVQLGHVEQVVGVYLRKFPNGGSWSLFICPTCGRRARTLRSLEGAVVCRSCCERRGVRHRACAMSPRQRAEHRIPKLKAMLESKTPLRLKPSTLWGTMEKRARHTAALQRAEFIVAQQGRPRKTKAIANPCDELDFKAPKLRPSKRG
jgi:hypothetical protein